MSDEALRRIADRLETMLAHQEATLARLAEVEARSLAALHCVGASLGWTAIGALSPADAVEARLAVLERVMIDAFARATPSTHAASEALDAIRVAAEATIMRILPPSD